jgi:hypothetical protein
MAALMENSKVELLDDLKATMMEKSKAALMEKPKVEMLDDLKENKKVELKVE